MLVAVADGFDHLAVVPRIGGIGIGEQQHQVNFIVGDPGVDLLMSALFMGKEQRQVQSGVVSNQPPGGGCGEQVVLHQDAFVGGTELHHQLFLFIVGQKCDVQSTHSFVYKTYYRRETGTGYPSIRLAMRFKALAAGPLGPYCSKG